MIDLFVGKKDATFPWAYFDEAMEAGFPIKTATFHGMKALHLAVSRGMCAVTKRLLDLGCDPFDGGVTSMTPMHVAARIDAVDVCKVLPVQCLTARTSRRLNTPLHSAVETGSLKVVQWMLEQPCAPGDAVNKRGLTPREEAERMDHLIERAHMLAAFAAHGRWSPLRAAWIGAAVGTKNIPVVG
jgi:ankyrin repeat protein